jgi:hypothetical protein
MTEGLIYWVGVLIGAPILTLAFVAMNQVSDGSIFGAGCFVALLCLLGLYLTVNEFQKM